MRIRQPIAGAFVALLLIAGYVGLFEDRLPAYYHSDKGLHFVTFFALTLLFYWILDTSRRRIIHLTLLVCTAGLSIGSEVVQAFLPNKRVFDPYDILSNVVGSALALALCSWYHKRMLERRRKNKHYDAGTGEDGDLEDGDRDVELGAVGDQETGVVSAEANGQTGGGAAKTNVTEELDHWDENEEDWEQGNERDGEADTGDKKRAD